MKHLIPLVIFIFIGCSSPSENTKAPFTLTSINNKEIHIEEQGKLLKFKEFSNQPTFIILFGHNCPPCLHEIPALIEFTKSHSDVNIMAIEVQHFDNNELKAFGEKKHINYTLLTRQDNSGFTKYIANKSSWNGAIPFLIAFNKEGKLYDTHLGGLEKSELEELYKKLQ